ncbi:MAG: type I methionyl aminopeptidase [Nitrospira sp.]|nr:type I methionyl aminopeptidase [bacterium]MBL7049308.1 type I methionyl aminopeptidase [Nitrospira sp.]
MIVLKSQDEIKRMSESCRLVAETLEGIKKRVVPGITTAEIDQYAEARIREKGAQPAFKGYRGYPATVCASINEQVVHGIPSGKKLKNGDILSLDIGVFFDGFYGDAAITVPVGTVSSEVMNLIKVTEESLCAGIAMAVPGNRLSDISNAIQGRAESGGYSVVRNFVGHGIGRELHEDPQIPNFGRPGEGPRLVEGMTLAIEPMVNAGGWEVKVLKDGWTAITKDGSLSAHFEHTVAITKKGHLILTKL